MVVVNAQPTAGTTTRIEAENWTAMSGVQTENTTDVGGGKNVGWIDNGDWMDYSISTSSAGSYTLNFRLATIYSGAQFQVKNSSGQVLATVNVPTTGGFQTWQTVSATVNLSAGAQTLRLQSSAAAGWNINWLELVGGGSTNPPPGSTTRIEAENWTAMSGVVREATTDVGGGQSVGYIDPGDWMEYSYSAPSTGSYTVSLRLAAPAAGGQLQIRTSSGTVLATVNVPNTGGWQSWQTVTTTLNLNQGAQTLRIVSTSPQYKGWNINWWELAAGGSNAAITQRRASMINEQQASSLELFPNPVTEHTVLRVNNSFSGDVRVQIISMNGSVQKEFRLFKEKGVVQTKLGTENLPAGSYIIKLTMDKWSDTKQIIKQ